MIVAGVGCRKGASADDIGAVIADALARAETRSERVLALMGIPCIAEAAALAGGGPTARLILPRIAIGTATCALAVSEERS